MMANNRLPQIQLSRITVNAAVPLHLQTVWHAQRFFERLRGLLGRPALQQHEGLLLTPCAQVHTFGMRSLLDVVFLDPCGQVLKCVKGLAPNRIAGQSGARHTLELAAGSIERQQLTEGDRLFWEVKK
jgi:uncharacterized membrane protein (UPF0127 family)